jgi:putative flippase GtrA
MVAPLRMLRRAWSSSAFRYLVIGGIAFLFDFGLLYLLHEFLGIAVYVATPVAFIASFALTYLMQRYFTFGATSAWGSSALKYTALVAFNTVATTLIVTGTDALGWSWAAGKVVAVTATTVWNYFAYRYWVFRAARVKS